MTEYRIRKIDDIINIVIPFFNKYKLQSEKRKDFDYIKIVANMMTEKQHLTLEGVGVIKGIQNRLHFYKEALN